jgi:hypothetical protein
MNPPIAMYTYVSKTKYIWLHMVVCNCNLENIQHKKGLGDVAQVVESLPSKHEALSPNPSTAKRKGKKRQSNHSY